LHILSETCKCSCQLNVVDVARVLLFHNAIVGAPITAILISSISQSFAMHSPPILLGNILLQQQYCLGGCYNDYLATFVISNESIYLCHTGLRLSSLCVFVHLLLSLICYLNLFAGHIPIPPHHHHFLLLLLFDKL